jgi:hypothetical protein
MLTDSGVATLSQRVAAITPLRGHDFWSGRNEIYRKAAPFSLSANTGIQPTNFWVNMARRLCCVSARGTITTTSVEILF